MDVSIIIVNYNTWELTSQCIDSIYRITEAVSFEVILVDNASVDGSRERFQNDTRIIYIYSEENLGFGRANNMGLSVAKGRNILFLNPDTLLLNNAVKILSSVLDSNTEVGVCGGNLYDAQMIPALSFKRIFPGIAEECNSLLFHVPEKLFYGRSWYHNYTSEPMDVAYVSGADLMVRKSVLDEVGAFSPEFFMYYEETDLCFRIAAAGYRIRSVPQACIQHLEGGSFQNTVNIRRLTFSENGRDVFYKRNYSPFRHKMANAICKIALAIHGIVYDLLRRPQKAAACRVRRQIISQMR